MVGHVPLCGVDTQGALRVKERYTGLDTPTCEKCLKLMARWEKKEHKVGTNVIKGSWYKTR